MDMDDSVADIRRLHETSARAGRILLPCAGAALLVLVAVASALVIQPLPFSDWTYYWEAARGTVGYERGGVLVYALRGLQLLQLPPYATALILNLTAASILLGVASRAERTRTGVATWLVYLYLLVIAPYYAVVQFDLAATALLCAGLACLADAGRETRAKVGMAVVLVACAVSSRPQFLLVILVFGGLVVCGTLLARGVRGMPSRYAAFAACVLMAGALAGFALDSALRVDAGRSEAVRTTSGVTLYAGLLSSGTTAPQCGQWSMQATRDARRDANRPLVEAVRARIKAKPPAHWLEVVACKAPSIALPDAYALSWSLGAPNVRGRLEEGGQSSPLRRATPYLYRLEQLLYLAVILLVYAYAAASIARCGARRQWTAALLPVGWLAAYWLVHAVFEIQPRYFLSLFLTLPIVVALLTRPAKCGHPQAS